MQENRARGGLARLPARLASGLLCAVVVLTAATVLAAHASSGDPSGSGRPATADPTDAPCVLERTVPECRTATTVSGHAFRYAVLRSVTPGAPTLLLDVGGPGASLFGAHWPGDVRPALPTTIRDVNLVMVEEPWVTADVPTACQDSLSGYFRTAHAGRAGDAASLARACLGSAGKARYGWSAESYRESVQEVLRREHLTLDGFLGASFASRRLGYLAPVPLRFAAIVGPAPLEMAAGRFLAERHDALVRLLATECGGCRPLDVVGAAAAAFDRAPATVSGRSVPVTGADVGAAVVALAYQPDDVRRTAWAALREPARNAALLGQLADTVWGRYDVDDVSSSWLAYLSEVCHAYPGWPATVAPNADPVERFLYTYHAPCAAAGDAYPATTARAARRICVVGSATDPVTPVSFAESWRKFPNVTLAIVDEPGHGSLRALAACAATFSAGR
jgi:hypothetical protein